jgi:hypothetical protein
MKNSANTVQPARYASQRIGLELKEYFLPLHAEAITAVQPTKPPVMPPSYDIIADKAFVN